MAPVTLPLESAHGLPLTTVGLPIALGIIRFGLGLSLTPDDFRRVAGHPGAVAVALGCQLVLLPLACFGLVELFDLPRLAVGMMLLAASPGGTSANLFSRLFRERRPQRLAHGGQLRHRDRLAAADHQPGDRALCATTSVSTWPTSVSSPRCSARSAW